jgi:hypothetical protein
LSTASVRLRDIDAYLAPGASIAADLAALGVPVADLAAADRLLGKFLTAGPGGGLDQIAAGTYSALVEVFDRARLALLAHAG